MSKRRSLYNNCNTYANQYMILVAIFASIISEEIEDDEDLGILGSFLIALGEELSLGSEIRISCKAKFQDQGGIEGEVEDVFDRNYINSSPKKTKTKKKVRKKKE